MSHQYNIQLLTSTIASLKSTSLNKASNSNAERLHKGYISTFEKEMNLVEKLNFR